MRVRRPRRHGRRLASGVLLCAALMLAAGTAPSQGRVLGANVISAAEATGAPSCSPGETHVGVPPCASTPTPPNPQTPPYDVSPAPCPSAATGTVCAPHQAQDYTTASPPPLPAQNNGGDGCTVPPPRSAPDTWTQYGTAQIVDYTQFAPSPSTTVPPGSPADEMYDMFPLPFLERIDPASNGCRAFRISVDGTRIERTLDFGATWSTVLDGTLMAPVPHFRQLFIGGSPGAGEIIYASETKNGDALVRSGDGGSTWQLADGTNSAGPANLVGEFIYSVTVSRQDPRIVYAISLVCPGQRPKTATECQHPPYYTGAGWASAMGPIRLYVSHDAGADWMRLADPSVNATNGVAEDDATHVAFVISDPYSLPGSDGRLHDHIWIVTTGSGGGDSPLGGNGYWHEGTWDGVGDGTTGYHFTTTGNSVWMPFTVVPDPKCTAPPTPARCERLFSNTYNFGFSDDDGQTWHAIASNDAGVHASAADAAGNRFSLSVPVYYQNDPQRMSDLRALFLQPDPGSGGYALHLGSAPPSTGWGYSQYGGAGALSDQHRRGLWDWPGSDPLIPPIFNNNLDTLASSGVNGQGQSYIDVDSAGNFYTMVMSTCYDNTCHWDGSDPDSLAGTTANKQWTKAVWRMLRYTPPASVSALPKLLNVFDPQTQDVQQKASAGCANQGRCTLVPLAQCSIAQDAGDQTGTLAFDGAHLFYASSGDHSPQPYTALIHALDPSDCSGAGTRVMNPLETIAIHFDPTEYATARSLARMTISYNSTFLSRPSVPDGSGGINNPTVDSMAYDATHDRLYFTLSPYPDPNTNGGNQVGLTDRNQLSLWEADLSSARHGGLAAPSVQAHLVTVETGYCPNANDTQVGAGSETLAVDRVDSSLWACLPGHPDKFDLNGNRLNHSCEETTDLQGGNSTGIHVFSWTMEGMKPGAPHRAFLLDELSNPDLILFDLSTCTENRGYELPGSLPGSVAQRPARGSQALACDPVTFGSGTTGRGPDPGTASTLESQDGASFPAGATPLGAVLWSRVGNQLTAFLIPDNNDAQAQKATPDDAQTCRLPVTLTSATPTIAATGAAVPICAALTVDGPTAPVLNQKVEVSLDGQQAQPLTMSAPGRYCLAQRMVMAAGYHTARFVYDQPSTDPTDLAFYPAGPVTTTIVVGGPAAGQPDQLPGPPGQLSRPQPGSTVPGLILPPVPQLAPAALPAGGGPPGQGTTATAQTAAAEQREEERQLAFAYGFDGDEEQTAQDGAPDTGPPGSDGTVAMSALHAQNGRDVLFPATLSLLSVAGVLGVALALRWSSGRSFAPARTRSSRRNRG